MANLWANGDFNGVCNCKTISENVTWGNSQLETGYFFNFNKIFEQQPTQGQMSWLQKPKSEGT